ncbi:uncharacterized protein LOC144215903 [Stigmatopora nigra]
MGVGACGRKGQGRTLGSNERMDVWTKQKGSCQPREFHMTASSSFRPGSHQKNIGLSTTCVELVGLQVQGLCCPLQQRDNNGLLPAHARRVRNGKMRQLTSANGPLRRGKEPVTRFEKVDGVRTVGNESTSKSAEAPNVHIAGHSHQKQQASTTEVHSELHLYLPFSHREEES